jgi:hypothetical protein
MGETCTPSAGIFPVQARRSRAKPCASILPMVLAGVLALSFSGCRDRESVLYPGKSQYSGESQKAAKDAYRVVTAEDGLQCEYRRPVAHSDQFVLDSSSGRMHLVTSATLLGFLCANTNGVFIDLELASYHMNQGNIETKQFGTIRTDGASYATQPVQFYMTEDQIVRIKEFLRSKR